MNIVGVTGFRGLCLWASQILRFVGVKVGVRRFMGVRVGVADIDETNTFQLKIKGGRHRLGRFVGMGVTGLGGLWAVTSCAAYKATNLNLKSQFFIFDLNLRSQFSIFDRFRDICVHSYDFFKFVGGL